MKEWTDFVQAIVDIDPSVDIRKMPKGIKHLYRQLSRMERLQNRVSRTRKPSPRGRAALVARQKKARPPVGGKNG